MPRRTFSRAELESFRDAEVPDLLPTRPEHDLRLLFVGINPGLWTAATGTHFAHPGNRFYPALLLAGVIDHPVDPADGMTDEDRDRLRDRGIGITNLARRATAKASELTSEELREGGQRLTQLVAAQRPRVVAVAGITAYRTAFGLPKAAPGRQPQDLAGAELWVVPNPSGLNAHETVTTLADAYRRVGEAAGIVPTARRTVVGAVIVDEPADGVRRVLAARRTDPPELAGRWEFPGGKVEPDETSQDALVREIREELGVTVAVGVEVADQGRAWPISEAYELRLFVTTVIAGDPTPRDDHDAVRWLRIDELHDVDWLESDHQALDAVRKVLAGTAFLDAQ